jgi:hypothetical protein
MESKSKECLHISFAGEAFLNLFCVVNRIFLGFALDELLKLFAVVNFFLFLALPFAAKFRSAEHFLPELSQH